MGKCKFLLLFALLFLLNMNFTLLRNIRNTLAVIDFGKGATAIPLFELLGVLPAAILMTWILKYLLDRFSFATVFFLTLSTFVSFFLLFVFEIYPNGMRNYLIPLFYILAELWKPALILILFWGMANESIELQEAKKSYAFLLIGASLGSCLAGPLISFATASHLWKSSLIFLTLFLFATSIVTALFFFILSKGLAPTKREAKKISYPSAPVRLLSGMVLADYIAYSLGEVIFLDLLKSRFPDSCSYCNYLGILSSWSSALTLGCSLFFAPYFLKNTRWQVAALITPLCLLITEAAFFLFLRVKGLLLDNHWLLIATLLGSIQYCVCRAAKYSFFDASKELAFIWMQSQVRTEAKLFIDGICARGGRAIASFLSLALITLYGGVFASSLLSGIIALGMGGVWVSQTMRLGTLMEHDAKESV